MRILSLGTYCTGMENYMYLQVVEAKKKNEELGGIIIMSETQQTKKKISVVCCFQLSALQQLFASYFKITQEKHETILSEN